MTENLEARLTATLEKVVGEELKFVRLDGDSLSLYFVGGPSDERKVHVEIEAPWRIVDDGEIIVGSGDAQRAGDHRQRAAAVADMCKRVLKKKAEGFELLDFAVQLAGEASVEHFADTTDDDSDQHFVAVHDTAFDGGDFYIGFGWMTTGD